MTPMLHRLALYVFWVSAGLVLYTYFVYPLILFAIYSLEQIKRDLRYLPSRADRRATVPSGEQLPGVSLVIAAYNEEKHLPEKLKNIRELQYPREKLQIIIVSDGSTDGTNEMLSACAEEQINVILLPVRRGKSNAVNVGVEHATNDILVFSDAATLFASDAVLKLARHFSVPTVGVVCGMLRFRSSDVSQQTEGVYWKYETMLRLMEARLGATLTASGAIYAIRRKCFSPLTSNVMIEDFVIPMRARRLGYSVHCDPEAVAIEYAASDVSGEFTRRVRLAVGSFRAMKELVLVPMSPITRLAFTSHKLLRWLVPFLLIFCLASNILVCSEAQYAGLLGLQLLLCLWAFFGYVFHDGMRRIRFGLLGYFWFAVNLAFVVGFWRFVTGRQNSAWQRVE